MVDNFDGLSRRLGVLIYIGLKRLVHKSWLT